MKCARGGECGGGKEVEVEFECVAGSVGGGREGGGWTGREESAGGTPVVEKEEAGYWRQEVEGLGGVVKKKFRKRERVGGTVREWEDEREGSGEVLWREKGGGRCWCGWCGRVVGGVGESGVERGEGGNGMEVLLG